MMRALTEGGTSFDALYVNVNGESGYFDRSLAAYGREGEPWHILPGGGYLRSVVYGFNDGLTANFGLVAGVIGADVAPHLVIVTGMAGAMADAEPSTLRSSEI